MVMRRLRGRAVKKTKVAVPGGRTVTHFKERKTGKNVCGRCGRPLGGTPSDAPVEVGKLAHSEKAPARKYAGILCGNCVESLVRYVTRFEVKFNYPEYRELPLTRDLTIERFLPAGWWDTVQKPRAEKKKKPRKLKVEKAEKKAKEKPAEPKKEKKPEKKEKVKKEKKTKTKKPEKKK